MISKIGLGTAQFGQDYGVANVRGKVSESEVSEILDYARSVGINSLDTAFAYGVSESVIGEYLKRNPGSFKVVSKLPAFGQYQPWKVEESLKQSMQRLGTGKLYGYLLHRFSDIIMCAGIWDDMIRLKQEGKIEKIGFSLYAPAELVCLLDQGMNFDMVQVPYSVFDRRFEQYFDILNKKGVEIQVRSVFLQGLAFLDPAHLPVPLRGAQSCFERLHEISAEQGIAIETLCLNFVVLNTFISKVLVGVDGLDHLKRNVKALQSIDKVTDIYDRLQPIKVDQEDILLPYKWGLNRLFAEKVKG